MLQLSGLLLAASVGANLVAAPAADEELPKSCDPALHVVTAAAVYMSLAPEPDGLPDLVSAMVQVVVDSCEVSEEFARQKVKFLLEGFSDVVRKHGLPGYRGN